MNDQAMFGAGTADTDAATPPIAMETAGARFGVSVAQRGRGVPQQLPEPYLMPSVHYVNGNFETVTPAIQQTPLGAGMTNSLAIPPAIPSGAVGAMLFPEPAEYNEFAEGVVDGYPEGCPVPYLYGKGAPQ